MDKDKNQPDIEPRKYLFSVDKLKYARGDRPKVDCILCGVVEEHSAVDNLVIYETNLSCVSINLYPYNPGHLLIFPQRHIVNYTELTDEEALDIHRLSSIAIQILSKAWRAEGFNIGYNLGKYSGGSIPHIHLHIVPRFPNEAGFLDVFANTRIVIYEPYKMKVELTRLWKDYMNQTESNL